MSSSNSPCSIIDLTHPLDPKRLTVYPGDPELNCCPISTVAKDGYSVHSLSLGSHTGTHIDAPSHFVLNGRTIDEIPLHNLISRPALVIDLTYKKAGSKILWDEDLAKFAARMKELGPGTILDRYAAEQVLSTGVKIVGLDTLSPDEIDGPEGFGVHEAILGSDGLIVENLTNLRALSELGGEITVSIVPLIVTGCDGSPVRAFGWKSK